MTQPPTTTTADTDSRDAGNATLGPVIIGIDWARETHAVCLIEPDGPRGGLPQHCELEQQPRTIAAWADELRRRFPDHRLHVVIEQSRGALVNALTATDQFQLFPINPKQLAKYREALHPSGRKNDPGDAELLARFLENHPDRLREWQPDSEHTRRIAYLVEFRRKLVEERKRVTQRLSATLAEYFPFVLEHFPKKLASPLITTLLKRWGTLQALKRPKLRTLEAFFKEHGVQTESRRRELAQAVRAAEPLTRDAAILSSHAAYAQSLAKQLADLVASIEQFDEQLAEAVAQHEDEPLFRSLPGAGDALVPRLIAAFGSDRDRYASAAELQNCTGIAPVTVQSGKQRIVKRRVACPKFLRQTFHEFADHARKWSPWSKVWYGRQRDAGMKHHAAVRALAFKWIRIIFRLWKNRETYSEQRYQQALINAGSPLAPLLKQI